MKPVFPSDLNNHCLVKPINLSNNSPHHGARGKLNFLLMFSLVKNSLNSSVLITFFSHLAAAWKVLALSEYIVLGLPLRPIKRLKHLMNSFVVKFGVNSKCTALLRLHEKRSMYALNSFFDFVW